mgnify:CR=1 FL=1
MFLLKRKEIFMEILSIVLSTIALIVSAVGVIASIVSTKLQYKRSEAVDIESDSANLALINGKEKMIPSFTYIITNTSNLQIVPKRQNCLKSHHFCIMDLDWFIAPKG